MDKQKLRVSRRRRIASVTSLVEFRAKRQGAASEALQVVSSSLGDHIRPLGDRCSTDAEGASNVDGFFEMVDNVRLVHADMLTIVPKRKQPCSVDDSLTLVNMNNWQDCKNLGDRLKWALKHSGASQADLAKACGRSSAAISKWFNGETSDLKMENLIKAADLLVVNIRWLAIGDGTPFTSIPSIYLNIAGPDLQIARDLTKLHDKKLRNMIRELIEAKSSVETSTAKRKSPLGHQRGA